MYLKYDPLYNLAHRLWEPTLSSADTQHLTPAADVLEEENAWVFRVDMPGVVKDNIHVEIDGDHLVVSGERHENTKEKQNGYTYIERVDGVFERRFALPNTTNKDKISAKIQNGVIEIRVEKLSEVKPRRISIEEH